MRLKLPAYMAIMAINGKSELDIRKDIVDRFNVSRQAVELWFTKNSYITVDVHPRTFKIRKIFKGREVEIESRVNQDKGG